MGVMVEDVFEQIQREKEFANALGIKIAFEPFGADKMAVEPEISDE
jgi:hypothetical protein